MMQFVNRMISSACATEKCKYSIYGFRTESKSSFQHLRTYTSILVLWLIFRTGNFMLTCNSTVAIFLSAHSTKICPQGIHPLSCFRSTFLSYSDFYAHQSRVPQFYLQSHNNNSTSLNRSSGLFSVAFKLVLLFYLFTANLPQSSIIKMFWPIDFLLICCFLVF